MFIFGGNSRTFRPVMPDVVRCECVMCGVVSHPAQELGPRTSSLRSLLSACDV